MEELNVNLLDYMTEEQMRDIAVDEFRNALRRFLYKEKDVERILANVSYNIVSKKLAEVTNKSEAEIEKILTENVKKFLGSDSVTYVLFRKGDAYCEEGVANPLLRKIVAESEGLMKDTVEKTIKEYDFSSVREGIMDMVYKVIEERLFEQEED